MVINDVAMRYTSPKMALLAGGQWYATAPRKHGPKK
jgi:hypothetical protein